MRPNVRNYVYTEIVGAKLADGRSAADVDDRLSVLNIPANPVHRPDWSYFLLSSDSWSKSPGIEMIECPIRRITVTSRDDKSVFLVRCAINPAISEQEAVDEVAKRCAAVLSPMGNKKPPE